MNGKKKLQIICSSHRLCFNCGKPGHFSRMCPLKHRSKGNLGNSASSPYHTTLFSIRIR
ncbi:hypothetical protein SKUD_184602 [Saccharomyces kudriavzevii IFO 1802]|uniref:CCHC-type domain-containing protein n=1 Tax=Saccharomyces kudriavzevii (strain ATCC MYA-4449 / AS 2.2408 / CBS 8840 / NBRC 1802 / NCYC 2889) TaxID=226230 RepID=J4TVB9_SACK1|nr:hypothetical protein SKUD_184602 [Saccharomyces kudriavzevii IFO 1802]